MPEMSDIFVLQADPTAYVQAMALADAAANQSKAVIKGLAQAGVSGNKEFIASLGEVSSAHVSLKGKISEVDRAYKEWVKAQAKGSDDVQAKEAAYKTLLAEIQQITERTAVVVVSAKKEMATAADRLADAEKRAADAAVAQAALAGANSRLGMITGTDVAGDQRLQVERMIAEAKREQAAAQQAVFDKASMSLAIVTQEAVAADQLRQSRIQSLNAEASAKALVAKQSEHIATIAAAGNAVVKEGMAEKIALYARLSKEEDELRAKMNATFRDAANGVPKAAEAYAVLDGQLKKVVQSKQKLGQETGIVSQKAMNANFVLGQLSYGAQDLVAVLSQPGMGLSDALRSTGNNVGVVAQVMGGPFMGLLATAGIMAASFGAKMLEAGDSAKKAKVDSEDFVDTLRSIASTAKESTDEIDALIKAQIDLGDIEFEKKMAPLRKTLSESGTKVENEQKNVDYYKAQLDRENAANPFGARKTSHVIEAYKKRLDAAKKEEMEARQAVEIAERVHNEAANRIERRKAEKDFDKRFAQVDAPLKVIADATARTYGPVDENAAIENIMKQSGIKPKNEDEAALLRKRSSELYDRAKTDATAASHKERLLPQEERDRRRAEIRSKEMEARAKEMRAPLAEQERQLQSERDAYSAAQWQATRPGSRGGRGGRDVSFDEQAELDARKEKLDANTRAHHETKAAIERLIEQMKKSEKAAGDHTKAIEGAGVGGGVGFRMALNPFAGLG